MAFTIIADPAGDVILAGRTNSSGFPSTANAVDPTFNGGYDGFIAKCDGASAGTLQYSTFLGGPLDDYMWEARSDANGDVIAGGSAESPAFPVTPGAFDTTHNGDGDMVLLKLPLGGVIAIGQPGDQDRASRLLPNSPNPFRSWTVMPFVLTESGRVQIDVFDVEGRRVRALVDGFRPAAAHQAAWDGTDDRGHPVADGVYYCRLRTDRLAADRAVAVLR